MLWSFKYNGNDHQGYHNKNRAVKGLKLNGAKLFCIEVNIITLVKVPDYT